MILVVMKKQMRFLEQENGDHDVRLPDVLSIDARLIIEVWNYQYYVLTKQTYFVHTNFFFFYYCLFAASWLLEWYWSTQLMYPVL